VDTPDAYNPMEESQRQRRGFILSGLLTLLALGIFLGVLFFAGGMDVVTGLFSRNAAGSGGSRSVATAPAASASVEPTVAPAKSELEMAKYIYAEQIESQANLNKLADGKVESIRIDSVDVSGDSSLVKVTVDFKDGTRAPGGMRFRRVGGVWYFQTITGLRSAKTGGSADSVDAASKVAEPLDADVKLAQVGVKTPDSGVLSTIAEQAKVNQPLFRDLMAGKYKSYSLGTPVEGPNTFTIPVTIEGSSESSISASIVLIAKTVEGTDRVFLTTFRKE
jgi:hypothetical protein